MRLGGQLFAKLALENISRHFKVFKECAPAWEHGLVHIAYATLEKIFQDPPRLQLKAESPIFGH